jgi:hypothetical protein
MIELAGKRIRLSHDGARDIITFSDDTGGRVCGDCQLCCRLLPIPGEPLHKPAGQRCRHQKVRKGCTIYGQHPFACKVFACRWLADAETAALPRPDRAHYVIDPETDYIEMTEIEGGPKIRVGVIQIWVDPAFRDAHKAPSIRAYILNMAERYRLATIVRFSSHEAIVIFPPPMCSDRQWHEEAGGRIVARDADDAMVLAEAATDE